MKARRLRGTVRSFDVEVGLGEVAADDGRAFPFHCTEIADGSRAIAAGAAVTFVVCAGLPGTWEASDIVPTVGGA